MKVRGAKQSAGIMGQNTFDIKAEGGADVCDFDMGGKRFDD